MGKKEGMSMTGRMWSSASLLREKQICHGPYFKVVKTDKKSLIPMDHIW
jgi:hypothetical protein